MNSNFRIPPLYCPLEPALHPNADHIEQRLITWLDNDSGVYRTDVERAWILAINGPELMSRVFPNGIEDCLVLGAQWYCWALGALDDAQFEDPDKPVTAAGAVELVCRLLRYLEAPDSPGPAAGPLARVITSLRPIMTALHACATPVQIQRLVEGHRHWLLGTLWQLGNTEHGVILDTDSYAIQRHASVAALLFMSWSEITAGEEIPGRELYSRPVRALIESAILINGWDNDFVSYRRETLVDNDSTQNIVTVVAREHDCSTQDAFVEAVAIRNRTMSLFVRLTEQLTPQVGSAMRSYIQDLGHLIRGSLDWSMTCPRYTCLTPRSEFPTPSEPLALTLADEPSYPDAAPSSIPSIAWWWDQLEQ